MANIMWKAFCLVFSSCLQIAAKQIYYMNFARRKNKIEDI